MLVDAALVCVFFVNCALLGWVARDIHPVVEYTLFVTAAILMVVAVHAS